LQGRRNLTFGFDAGYVNSLTLPKSSPVASKVLSGLRFTTLMSVPSAPSGQIPIVSKDTEHDDVAHSTSRNDEPLVI
jgi:hypothetical protein